jgi:hypothetical protein
MLELRVTLPLTPFALLSIKWVCETLTKEFNQIIYLNMWMFIVR